MAQNVLMAEVARAMNIKPADPGFCFNGVLRGEAHSLASTSVSEMEPLQRSITCQSDGEGSSHQHRRTVKLRYVFAARLSGDSPEGSGRG